MLTPRERELARMLLSSGANDSKIALAMGIKRRTIRAYMGRLFDLTGMDDRLNLGLYILRNPKLLSEVMGTNEIELDR
jgi:DNA-binding CsgD family transcriptional regulator